MYLNAKSLFLQWDFAERLSINLSQVLFIVIIQLWIQEGLKWLWMPWYSSCRGPHIACTVYYDCVCDSHARVQISRKVCVQKSNIHKTGKIYILSCTEDQSCRPADWDLPLRTANWYPGSTILSLLCQCHHTSIFSPDLQSCLQYPCFPLWEHIQYYIS